MLEHHWFWWLGTNWHVHTKLRISHLSDTVFTLYICSFQKWRVKGFFFHAILLFSFQYTYEAPRLIGFEPLMHEVDHAQPQNSFGYWSLLSKINWFLKQHYNFSINQILVVFDVFWISRTFSDLYLRDSIVGPEATGTKYFLNCSVLFYKTYVTCLSVLQVADWFQSVFLLSVHYPVLYIIHFVPPHNE